MKRLVANTGPILHLHEAGADSYLAALENSSLWMSSRVRAQARAARARFFSLGP
jgi:hypothetical protein